MSFHHIKKYLRFEYISVVLFFVGLFFIPIFYLSSLSNNLHLPKELFLYGIVGAIILTSFLSLLQNKNWTIHRTFIDIPMLLLVASAIISTLFSLASAKSFWGVNDTFSLHLVNLCLFVVWSWYILQTLTTEKFIHFTTKILMLSGLCAQIYFWINDISFFREWIQFDLINPVDSFNSVFGIYIAVILVLSLAQLLPKGRSLLGTQIFSGVVAILSLCTLLRLDFSLVWGILAFGCGGLFLLGMLFFSSVRKITQSAVFILFIASIFLVLTNTFSSFAKQLPTELNLSAKLSWNIVENSFLSNTRQFLFGVGPGNFVYTFSEFRPEVLNTDPFFWSVRFDAPYNSLFLWMSEFGFFGTTAFLLLILIVFGCILSVFLHVRENVKHKMQSFLVERNLLEEHTFTYLAYLVVFCMVTLGLFVSLYHFTLWFVWWTLLPLCIIVMSRLQPELMRRKDRSFFIAPQHLFVISFLFLVAAGFWVGGGVVYGKKILAEYALFQATSGDQQEQALKQAIEYDKNSSKYHLLLAKYYLQEALQISEENPAGKIQALSRALEEAVVAKELDPHNVAIWEVLSSLYINSLAISPSGMSYALEAVKMSKKLEPTNPIFYWQLGFLANWNKEYGEAEKSYQASLRLKPDYLQAVFDLASLYETQNLLAPAIGVYEKALSTTSDEQLYFQLGRLYFNRKEAGDDEKATQAWQKALEIKPDYSDVLYSLGLLFERKGERDLARGYFEQVKQLNPENTDIDKKLRAL